MPQPCSPNGSAPDRALKTTHIPISQATKIAPTGTTWARFPRRRPTSAVNRKPSSGRAMIAGIRVSNISGRSLPHRVVLVDERRLLAAVDRDDDRQTDGRIGGGDGHHEEGDHGAAGPETRHERAERDDREVDRVQHQLDRHQHADRIAPGEEAEHPDREQEAREDQVAVQRPRAARGQGDHPETDHEDGRQDGPDDDPDHSPSSVAGRSRLARKIPPITAASRSTPTISNGSTQSEKSWTARSLVSVAVRWPEPPHWVAPIVRARTTTRTTAAIAAGTACVWKTSRAGAAFVWVSMIAKRIRTLIAPM